MVLADGVVTTEAAGSTGRLVVGCGAAVPDAPNGVPVDEVAVLAGRVGAGAEGCAAIEPDAKFAGAAGAVADDVAGADACAIEPDAEPDAPLVDGVAAGATVDAGVDARASEP